MSEETTGRQQRSILFTKQPIFDAKRAIWGYELLGTEMQAGVSAVFTPKESGAGLYSSTSQGLQEAMQRGKKIMVGFDDSGILTGMPHALPAENGVIRLLPAADRASGLNAALQTLRGQGYQVMLDSRLGHSPAPDLQLQADIIGFDWAQRTPQEKDLALAAQGGVRLLARGLKTREQFVAARDLGFALFQGSFFKEPERVPDRKLGSTEITRLNLFRLMEAEEPDIKGLAAAIRADVAVSFRLLAFLNSAAFGFRHRVQSIDQAIMLLGWVKLKGWLRAVLLVDLAGQDEVPQELALLSLERARLLEQLASEYDYWGFNPSALFLVGLFSLMDAILGQPMEEVVELLPLEAKLKVALRRDPDSELQPLFSLLECLEDADWTGLDGWCQQLCLEPERVKELFVHARGWAEGFFTA